MGAQISLDDYCSQTKPYSQPYNLGWKQHQNFGWSKNQNRGNFTNFQQEMETFYENFLVQLHDFG